MPWELTDSEREMVNAKTEDTSRLSNEKQEQKTISAIENDKEDNCL